jgi:hypothetical protein
MVRWCLIALLLTLLPGCGGSGRMAHPEDPKGRYHDQIAAAKRLLEQNENWAGRAEWEVAKSADGWEITAWRIEHPEAKGPARYLPWGYSVIELDNRLVAVHYQRKG